MKKQLTFILLTFIFNLLIGNVNAWGAPQVENPITLTNDGAWCWFADPRAVYYEGTKKQTYFTWVTSLGDIMIGSYNHDTNEYKEKVIHARLEIDDHDVPAILIRNDGRIVVFYSKHQSAGPMQRVVSTDPEDISSFSSSYTWGSNVSYPNPFQVGDDIYLLYRGINWHPTIAISTDNAQTFPTTKQLVLNGGARPYARYCQSADGSIHIAVTTGHPRNESQNKIFYFRLKDNKFYKADGTLIKEFTMGIDLGDTSGSNSEAEMVYNGKDNGRGWIWDITVDPETQNPVMVYASFPTENDHRYNYAYWDGEKWVNKEIVKSGKWFPQTPAGTTEREPHYSGGLSMDHENPWVVYLSKQVSGVFEIFKYETTDKGDNWTITAITENTPDNIVNVRPIVPRNHREGYFDVLWMRGKYGYYYQDFKTEIAFQMSAKTDEIESITLNQPELSLSIGDTETLVATLFPLISNNKLEWSSSNEEVATVSDGGVITALKEGTSDITVTAVNGKVATCKLTVTPRAFLSEAFFDFGTADSPLAENAVRITESTLLQGSYGWMSPVISRNRSATTDSERRDFNMNSTPGIFKVYLKNGTYNVKVLQGDSDYAHDKMRITVNGVIKADNVTCAKGQFITSEFKVAVSDNLMEFKFEIFGNDPNWVVNSIRIEPEQNALADLQTADIFNHPEAVITVYNLLGNVLLSQLQGGADWNELQVNSKLPGGVYIIKANLKDETSTKKVALK